MQVGDTRIAGRQQPPPDHGGNAAQRDPELIYLAGNLVLVRTHRLLPGPRSRLAVLNGRDIWSEMCRKTTVFVVSPLLPAHTSITTVSAG